MWWPVYWPAMHLNKWIFIKQSPNSFKSWSGTSKCWREVSSNSVNNNLWLNCNLSFAFIIHCRLWLKSALCKQKTTHSRQCLNRQFASVQHEKPDSKVKQKSSWPDLWQGTRVTNRGQSQVVSHLHCHSQSTEIAPGDSWELQLTQEEKEEYFRDRLAV